MSYIDPFADLNDQKRREREALLNSPINQNNKPLFVPTNISRRDYFAAAALQGLLAQGELSYSNVAQLSAQYADALLSTLDAVNEEKNV